MIRLLNVSKQYSNGQFGLRNVSLEIPANTLVFITGPTGAGKTTFATLLALWQKPTEGQIIVGDTDLAELSRRQISRYRRSIGIYSPDLPLLNDRNVGDNVAVPLLFDSLARSKINSRVANTLDMVGLRSKHEFSLAQLTDAEQQRVKIARAIVLRPPFIIADEPTANMDNMLGTNVMTIFKRFAGRNTTVVVTTHNRSHFSDRRHPVIEFRQGQLLNASQGAVESHGK